MSPPTLPNYWLRFHLSLGESRAGTTIKVSYCNGPTVSILSETEVDDRSREVVDLLGHWLSALDPSGPPFPFGGEEQLVQSIAADVRDVAMDFREAVTAATPYVIMQDMPGLPVFATSNSQRATCAWTEIVRAWLASQSEFAVPVEVVGAPDVFETTPKPIQLPIRIRGVGGPEVQAAIQFLQEDDATWYFRDEAVQEFGLRIEGWMPDETELLRSTSPPDIIVTSEIDPRRLFTKTSAARPRLIIILRRPGSYLLPPYALTPGVAVAEIPFRPNVPQREDLGYFLEELTHDSPLHEAMENLRRNQFSGEWADYKAGYGRQSRPLPRLYADPASNQGLRLSPLLPEIRRAAAEVYSFAQPADIARFATGLGKAVGPELVESVGTLSTLLLNFQTPGISFQKAEERQGGIKFDRETDGLVPMARLAAATKQVSQAQSIVAQDLAELVGKPEIQAALEKVQERKVDARLFKRWPEGTLSSISSEFSLPPGEPLRLTVHIGQRSDGSLVVGEVPAVDPLLPPLPDEQTHQLDIVVFPKDFVLESEAIQTVSLSRFGGTAPVDWDIRAPVLEPDLKEELPPAGKVREPLAELRFAVYYKNQLLQSFRLRAVIGTGEALRDGKRVLIECDFSQTRRFGGIDRLPDRIASFGLNRDLKNSHTLTLKKDGRTAELSWTEGQMANFTADVRTALHDALDPDAEVAPFSFDPTTLKLTSSPPPAFAEAVNSLARKGCRLYEELGQRHPLETVSMLRELREMDEQVLQITRLDPGYAFPWPLLYDFDKPRPPRGQIPGVCLGKDSAGVRCRCHEDSTPARWCLRGFWGFRFVVEQLCDGPDALDDSPGKIANNLSTPALRAVIAVKDDFVDAWTAAMKGKSKPSFEMQAAPTDFLASLRAPQNRPPLVIYIGHQADDGTPSMPNPQLVLQDGTTILDISLCNREFGDKNWLDAPRSLILLLACGSGTQRVDTGTSLAAALLRLGVVGVLATECTVLTGIVARIAQDLSNRLALGEKMGTAMRETIFELAVEGCPLGLAFTYLGTADARLPL
jgi:hypothetical protein